jgi:hypothetical protein
VKQEMNIMRLVYTSGPRLGKDVKVHDMITVYGDQYEIHSIERPPKLESTGRVIVHPPHIKYSPANEVAYYPSVIGAEWVEREDRQGQIVVTEKITNGKEGRVVINSVTEMLSLIDSFDGYGMVATDEELQVTQIRELYPNLKDDYEDRQGPLNDTVKRWAMGLKDSDVDLYWSYSMNKWVYWGKTDESDFFTDYSKQFAPVPYGGVWMRRTLEEHL